jgi:hypothetical protein
LRGTTIAKQTHVSKPCSGYAQGMCCQTHCGQTMFRSPAQLICELSPRKLQDRRPCNRPWTCLGHVSRTCLPNTKLAYMCLHCGIFVVLLGMCHHAARVHTLHDLNYRAVSVVSKQCRSRNKYMQHDSQTTGVKTITEIRSQWVCKHDMYADIQTDIRGDTRQSDLSLL